MDEYEQVDAARVGVRDRREGLAALCDLGAVVVGELDGDLAARVLGEGERVEVVAVLLVSVEGCE